MCCVEVKVCCVEVKVCCMEVKGVLCEGVCVIWR